MTGENERPATLPGARGADEFIVTDQHLKLLRHMYVQWNGMETGAPTIDPKRPYGNGDVAGDIRDILDLAEIELPDEAALDLHRQTQAALQIALHTGWFGEGLYIRHRHRDWTKAT